MDLPVDATLANIMGRIKLPREESYISLVYGQSIVPDDRAGHAISDGDEITSVPAIQNGAKASNFRQTPNRVWPDRRLPPA